VARPVHIWSTWSRPTVIGIAALVLGSVVFLYIQNIMLVRRGLAECKARYAEARTRDDTLVVDTTSVASLDHRRLFPATEICGRLRGL
jgi:hypothetical protein